jgi:Tfp pilus assembly protein PilE
MSMAFCTNCGKPITGNHRFCAECGADVTVQSVRPAARVSPPAAPPVTPYVQSPPVQPMGVQSPFPAGAVPVMVPVAAPSQTAQRNGIAGTVVVVLILAALGYYYFTKYYHPSPSGSGTSGADAALVDQQSFDGHWRSQSGMLSLTTATWSNHSNTDITSAILQCRQYNGAGTDLSEYRITLNGPTNAGATSNFSNISLGATATGMTRVTCSIVGVKP